MAQNKKIKYTTMTAKALAEMITEKLKTTDDVTIENVLLPSKMKHGEGFIDIFTAYPSYNIIVKDFIESKSDDIDKVKTINFKNCKLRDAWYAFASSTKNNMLNIRYRDCEVQHFNVQLSVGVSDIQFNNCTVQNCGFYYLGRDVNHQGILTAREGTVFEYCLFEHCKASNFVHHNNEKFVHCKFNDCDFVNANLADATFNDCLCNTRTTGFQLVCPEKGEYIAFKKAIIFVHNKTGKNVTSDVLKKKCLCDIQRVFVIVELKIPADALRSSATTRKCRASKAKVLSITSFDGKKRYKKALSAYRAANNFVYEVGKTVVPANGFERNRWVECASGIHHFITRDEAVAFDD